MKLNELYALNLKEKQQLNEWFWVAAGLGFAAYEAYRYSKKIKNGTMTPGDWKQMGTDMLFAALVPPALKTIGAVRKGIGAASKGGIYPVHGGGTAKTVEELNAIKKKIAQTINSARNDPNGSAAQLINKTLHNAKSNPVKTTVGGTGGVAAGRYIDDVEDVIDLPREDTENDNTPPKETKPTNKPIPQPVSTP